jgi:3-methyladenine DNA glycosylase/8-oxoguanine DNA glycosylase
VVLSGSGDVARLTPRSSPAANSRARKRRRCCAWRRWCTRENWLLAQDDRDATCAALLAVKGIGPWTVNYALLRGYGYADCSLHGDVAIRAAFQHLLGEDSKPDMPRTELLLAHYKPHRTMAAAHLWASLAT